MDQLLLRVFQGHVAAQCRFALAGVPVIDESARQGDHDRLWIGCQMLVLGAGNVSKALWGDGRHRRALAPRRRALRESLNVTDASPLHQVAIRNHLEHFDERIDCWWGQSSRHNFLDDMIGPPSAVAGFTEIEMFRIYDPTPPSGPRIVFWGQSFDLQPLAEECSRIFTIASREAGRWP